MPLRRAALLALALIVVVPGVVMAESLSQFTPKQKRIIRRAAKKYDVPSRVLFAQAHTESRNNMGAVSSAGARGAFQFMEGTAPSYDVKFDGPGAYRSQAEGAARYLTDLGFQQDPRGAIAGYAGGPGNPQYGYADMLLQTADRYRGYGADALKGQRVGRSDGQSRLVGDLTTIPGEDNSAARDQLRTQALTTALGQNRMPSQSELLGLASGLSTLEDTPAETSLDLRRVRTKGGGAQARGDVRLGNGQSLNQIIKRLEVWDKAKRPYLWGGGHGRTAKPGEDVDCSGLWSGALGLDVPLTSGGFLNWGKPGEGRHLTLYTNEGHILGKVKDSRSGKWRWFATSKSNPGGGAGEIAPPDAGYLSNFTARRPG